MTNRRGQKGFSIIVVLCLVALAGMAIALLASGSNTLRFDTQRMQYNSARRNLVESGLAWAKLNADKIPPAGKELPLDGMELPDAGLHITVDGDKPEVRIRTTCRYGRKLIEKNSRHTLQRRP